MNQLLTEAEARATGPLAVLHIRLGRLSGVVPEAFQFAFEALAPGTRAAGARLALEEAPIRMHCRHCNMDYEADLAAYACPRCQAADGDLIGGREVELTRLEVFENV